MNNRLLGAKQESWLEANSQICTLNIEVSVQDDVFSSGIIGSTVKFLFSEDLSKGQSYDTKRTID